jgi:hypothetical protein
MLERTEPITVRLAAPDDLMALRRLVDRDGGGAGTRHMLLDLTKPDKPPRVLIASARDDAIAALHIDSGHSVADPFVESRAALELLRTRARQLRGAERRRHRRRLVATIAQLRPGAG